MKKCTECSGSGVEDGTHGRRVCSYCNGSGNFTMPKPTPEKLAMHSSEELALWDDAYLITARRFNFMSATLTADKFILDRRDTLASKTCGGGEPLTSLEMRLWEKAYLAFLTNGSECGYTADRYIEARRERSKAK